VHASANAVFGSGDPGATIITRVQQYRDRSATGFHDVQRRRVRVIKNDKLIPIVYDRGTHVAVIMYNGSAFGRVKKKKFLLIYTRNRVNAFIPIDTEKSLRNRRRVRPDGIITTRDRVENASLAFIAIILSRRPR